MPAPRETPETAVPASGDFYADLPVRTRFADITDPAAYVPAPDDWLVAITDVRGSTTAIRKGRYKAVNLVGASAIIALLNLEAGTDLPFTFGGDGAAVLVPPHLAAAARVALADTRRMARDAFGLDLRAGLVPIADVRTSHDSTADVRVARIAIDADCHQAMFDGGGLARAEALVKNPVSAGHYAVPPTPGEADFSGLECRWQDIPSPYGETVSLLVTATTGSPETDRAVYAETLRHIEAVYGDGPQHRPLSPETLFPSFHPGKLSLEAQVQHRGRRLRRWVRRWLHVTEIWLRNGLLKYFVANQVETGSGVRWDRYVEKLVATSDYRKYDDTLRMVIAGTTAQRERLEQHLEAEHRAGRLVYGTHVTDRALVTCVVFERMGRQVHFVDGADGGYALAAADLKQRLARFKTPEARVTA